MRQLLVQVPRGEGQRVLAMAQEREGTNLACTAASGPDGSLDLVVVHLSNHRVAGFLEDLERLTKHQVTWIPRGVFSLRSPVEEIPPQVIHVEPRSPIEVFLGALQSIGSWKSFLGYAAASGVVVWIGLFTNTIFLLVAAMLISPYAGPAMVTAVGTARGDWRLFGRGAARYFAGLMLAVAVAAFLSLVLGQQVATIQMVAVSEVSSTAALLPLVAGAVGALHLIQSERDSLVSGAAVGIIVAASLAPPAGVIGMAATLGRWDLVGSGAFLLFLQLMGINVAGALGFRMFGLTSQGARYERGSQTAFFVILAATILAFAALLIVQFATTPDLQRSTIAQRAAAQIRSAIDESGLARAVEVNVRFTRETVPGQETLLAVLYVQRASDLSAEEIRRRLTNAVQARLLKEGFNLTPLIDVTLLEPPQIN